MSITKRVTLWVLAVATLSGLLVEMRAETAARKKARYYYTAGSVEKARGDEAAAFEYYKRAYNIDPTYAEAALNYGISRLGLPLDTMQTDTELQRSLSMMRQFVDEYPDDVNEAQYYAYIATQLGNMDESKRVLQRTYERHPKTTSTLLHLSDVYARTNELDKAIEAIDIYERNEGMNPQLTTHKMSYMLAKKDTVGAINAASRLIATDPRNVSYTILKGNLFDIIEMHDSALNCYELAERLDPEAGMPKLSLANYYQQRGDSAAYDKKMYEVLLCEDLDLDMKADMLAHYLQELISGKQDTQRGDVLFEVLKGQYPHEAQLLDLAARYSAAKGDYSDAVEQISYALNQDQTNSVYWGQLMSYLAASGNYDESLKAYEEARQHIEIDPGLRISYAVVAQMGKRYDLAVGAYKEMIDEIQEGLPIDSVLTLRDVRRDISLYELDRLSSLVSSIGDLYHEQGDNERAYRMYDNALTLNPANALAANNYAYFLSLDGGDLDKALSLSKQSLSGENADNPTYLDTYAWILYLKGDYATALEYQQKVIDSLDEKGGSAELFDHYGDILAKLDRLPEAVEAWKKAAKIMEDSNQTDEPEYPQTLQKIEKAGI